MTYNQLDRKYYEIRFNLWKKWFASAPKDRSTKKFLEKSNALEEDFYHSTNGLWRFSKVHIS